MCWNKFIHTPVLSWTLMYQYTTGVSKLFGCPKLVCGEFMKLLTIWIFKNTAQTSNLAKCKLPGIYCSKTAQIIFLEYNSQMPSELSTWEFNYLITDFFHCCNGSALKVTAFLSEVHKDVFWYPFLHHVQWAVHDFWDTSGELVREILYQFLRDTFSQRSDY